MYFDSRLIRYESIYSCDDDRRAVASRLISPIVVAFTLPLSTIAAIAIEIRTCCYRYHKTHAVAAVALLAIQSHTYKSHLLISRPLFVWIAIVFTWGIIHVNV